MQVEPEKRGNIFRFFLLSTFLFSYAQIIFICNVSKPIDASYFSNFQHYLKV